MPSVIWYNYLTNNRITSISKEIFAKYSDDFKTLSVQEENTIKLLTSHFYKMPLSGDNGLKSKTQLLESKYDA
jgi:hypothetical protein